MAREVDVPKMNRRYQQEICNQLVSRLVPFAQGQQTRKDQCRTRGRGFMFCVARRSSSLNPWKLDCRKRVNSHISQQHRTAVQSFQPFFPVLFPPTLQILQSAEAPKSMLKPSAFSFASDATVALLLHPNLSRLYPRPRSQSG